MSREYILFTEENEHEGETWNRFIKTNDENLPSLMQAVQRLHELHDHEEDFPFSFSVLENDEIEVFEEDQAENIVSVNDGDSGYSASFDFASCKHLDLKNEYEDEEQEYNYLLSLLYKLSWVKM